MALPRFTAEASLLASGRSYRSQALRPVGPEGATLAQLALPIYGNHCGPGYGNPSTPPVDAVDAVCYRHDRCYERQGYFNCGCDRQLIFEMSLVLPLTPNPVAHTAGTLIRSYFQNAPCLCYPRFCVFGACVPLPPVPGFGGVGPC